MPFMPLHLRSITFLSWTMLAMHGGNALKPCAICHVPRDALHRLNMKHPQHSKLESCQIIQKAQTMGKGPAEDLLRSYGLCAHQVCVYKQITELVLMLPSVTNRVSSPRFTTLIHTGHCCLTYCTPGKKEYGEVMLHPSFRMLFHSLVWMCWADLRLCNIFSLLKSEST